MAALMLAACSTNRNRQVDVGPIDELVLLSAPAAVDVEPTPGPDGVAVRLYATSHSKSKALTISRGKIEVMMFDGAISEDTPSTVQPLKVWSNSAAELRPFATRTAIGVSYPLTLLWGNARPGGDNITIVARYIPENGRAIYSSPSTIPVGGTRRPKPSKPS